MANEKEATVAKAEPADAASPGAADAKTMKVVLLLIILSILVMVLTPIITIFAVKEMTRKVVAKPAAAEVKEEKEITIPKLDVNIGETGATRVISLDVVVRVSDASMETFFTDQTPENMKGHLKQIKAKLNTIIGGKTLEGLTSADAKTKLAKEIKDTLNEFLKEKTETEGVITDVYFPSYLIQ